MLVLRWASVADGGPTLNQHWLNNLSTYLSIEDLSTRCWASVTDGGPTLGKRIMLAAELKTQEALTQCWSNSRVFASKCQCKSWHSWASIADDEPIL